MYKPAFGPALRIDNSRISTILTEKQWDKKLAQNLNINRQFFAKSEYFKPDPTLDLVIALRI
jgi:hypothetical protein